MFWPLKHVRDALRYDADAAVSNFVTYLIAIVLALVYAGGEIASTNQSNYWYTQAAREMLELDLFPSGTVPAMDFNGAAIPSLPSRPHFCLTTAPCALG